MEAEQGESAGGFQPETEFLPCKKLSKSENMQAGLRVKRKVVRIVRRKGRQKTKADYLWGLFYVAWGISVSVYVAEMADYGFSESVEHENSVSMLTILSMGGITMLGMLVLVRNMLIKPRKKRYDIFGRRRARRGAQVQEWLIYICVVAVNVACILSIL